jgi:hypothetical protein
MRQRNPADVVLRARYRQTVLFPDLSERLTGHDLRRLFFSRARIVYRKPCFRGEGYRREAWFQGEAPLAVAGAFRKADDPPEARPAVAVELTLAQHE